MTNIFREYLAQNLRKPGSGFFGWYVTKNIFLRRNVILEESAVKLCQIEPHHNVLEVGFGPGVGLEAACKHVTGGNGKIYGIDFSDKMISLAKRRLSKQIHDGKVCIQKENVLDLPFENDTFHRVFHCNCYYFWPDLQAGCRELYRVMRPHARMVTTIRVDSIKAITQKNILKYGQTSDHVEYMKTLEKVGFKNVIMRNVEDSGQTFQAIFADVDKT
ncbi:uncharacterized methyltransferase YdaC-like [Mytilus edulis]|uniref:uncharacterized methyltransferase YdaC-like n=1 Tax=Mytilus edulis TaxID=6550 RepID=UPI0039EF7556